MQFIKTPLPGVWLIVPKRIEDERGWFARTFDHEAFVAHGCDPTIVQCNASYNEQRDTIRGLHYQAEPYGEPKLVRCVRGAIFDVAVDLRPESEGYCRWYSARLSAENGHALYVPPGLAHGFQTLVDGAEVHYQMGERYVAAAGRGVRYNDPAFAITWPDAQHARIVSARDASYPDFKPGHETDI
jgi:dTDP-4-dehydrorhamnose 3,5-epimerase